MTGYLEKDEFVRRIIERHPISERRAFRLYVAARLSSVVVSFVVVFGSPIPTRIVAGILASCDLYLSNWHVWDLFTAWPIRGSWEVWQLLATGAYGVIGAAVLLSVLALTVYTTLSFVGSLAGGQFAVAIVSEHRYEPVDFIYYTYLGVAAVAVILHGFEFQFLADGEIHSLSALNAFYFAATTLATGPINIYPASAASKVFSIMINAATLMLGIYVFRELGKDREVKRGKDRLVPKLGKFYDTVIAILEKLDLEPEVRSAVVDGLANDHNFNPDMAFLHVRMDLRHGVVEPYLKRKKPADQQAE